MLGRMRVPFAAILLAAVLAAPPPAAAGPFDVSGVAVRARADDAVAAKEAAVADGQARALEIVLRRLTRAADAGRLPRVAPEEADTLIAFFGVEGEQTSATDYIATLNFRFEPAAVQELLRRAGVPFTTDQAAPVLVVPVFRQGEDFVFRDGSPTFEAWRSFDLDNTLTPVRLPTGNVVDNGLDPNAVLARDADTMSTLRYLYRIDNVLVSLCETDRSNSFFTCTLEGGGPVGPVSLREEFAGGSDPLAAAQAAVGSFLAQLEDQWKERNISRLGAGTGAPTGLPVPVAVAFSGLAEWQQIRTRLVSVPGVSTVEIRTLNPRGALLSVYYSGSGEQLAGALAAAGMNLSSAGDHWVLGAN